jgi:hypothetical protein
MYSGDGSAVLTVVFSVVDIAVAVAVSQGVEFVMEAEVDIVEVVRHLQGEGAIREVGTRVMVVVAVPVTEEISIIV